MSKFIGFRALIAGSLLLGVCKSYCGWNPEILMAEHLVKDEFKENLQNSRFTQLKEKVKSLLGQSWCSQEKATLIMDLIALEKPQVCVEIGVFSGGSFLPIGATVKYFCGQGQVYGIDPWSNEEAIRHMEEGDPNKNWWSQVNMNDLYKNFMTMFNHWEFGSHCTILKTTSVNAAPQIGPIDFLHMDGNYTMESSIEDVFYYLPKVKKGGYILFSNLLITVNGEHPKMEAFDSLLDSCEYVCEIENNNCMLLRKMVD